MLGGYGNRYCVKRRKRTPRKGFPKSEVLTKEGLDILLGGTTPG